MAAARCDAIRAEVVELTQLGVSDLDPLLNEEISVWKNRFDWDFRASADLLRRFLQIRSLFGYALRFGPEVIGYSYYVCEGRKGLIGDFYVRNGHQSAANEVTLLGATVQGLMLTHGVQRIESQLMLLQNKSAKLPFDQNLARHDRFFMDVECGVIPGLAPRTSSYLPTFSRWAERFHEDVAHLVTAAYRGHVDSEINDQYRSIPGARHFLTNIIRYPGCGNFSSAASTLAVDQKSGRVTGACLASMVSATSGHITQLCVLPALRGSGLGYQLLRQSLKHLAELGCKTMSLTVTSTNVDAIRLYKAVGFRSQNTFPALVWEGF